MDDQLPEGRVPYDEWLKTKRYAIVKTISTFYHVYAVPLDLLQTGNTDAEVDPRWLEDAVVMEEIEELGQQHLGEQIIGKAETVDEEDEPFTRYQGDDELMNRVNECYDTWDQWEPQTPLEMIVKSSADNVP